MTPSEIFKRSRDAAIRIREIDVEKGELWDRIGVQGYKLGPHSKSSILDPMRKVDDYVDGSADLDVERMECMYDVRAALTLIQGVRAFIDDSDVLMTTMVEFILESYVVRGADMADIAKSCGIKTPLCREYYDRIVKDCDEIGVASLRAAAIVP